MRSLANLGILALSMAATGCLDESSTNSPSGLTVIGGQDELEYPYVVQIIMDTGSACTGSFLSDSLLITAAHCVDRAKAVRWREFTADRSKIFIHPWWPSPSSGCDQAYRPNFDVALVRFPEGTYRGRVYGKLLMREARTGENFTIVGYGNNVIKPFETFCTLPRNPLADDKCYVHRGVRNGGGSYDFTAIFGFAYTLEENASSCPIPCSIPGLIASLAAEGISPSEFVTEQCNGNFRDRHYLETGIGVKRSGSNSILGAENGLIHFQGPADFEDLDLGVNSSSGAGDSGGPLFIFKDGLPRLAGVAHGGNLISSQDGLIKRSVYVDLAAPHNMAWLQTVVKESEALLD